MACDFSIELKLRGPVCGVDEAGRGPLAGPVVAAAVILDQDRAPIGIDDSKKLNAPVREALFDLINANAHVGVGIASVEEIDSLNILWASMLAMERAVAALPLQPAHALVDGNRCPKSLPCASTPVIGGDARSISIAAASIIAKVTRDRLMRDLDSDHPGYGFAGHKGYGTPAHLAALERLGPCLIHRRSFAPIRQGILPLETAAVIP